MTDSAPATPDAAPDIPPHATIARKDAQGPGEPGPTPGGEPVLDIRRLRVEFPIRRGFLGRTTGRVHAVTDVDLTIRAGETLGLVGESGCGKTTLGRCVVGSIRPTAGEIRYRPRSGGEPVDLATLSTRALRPFQREVRLVFQDPFSSLNPRMTLRDIIGEPLRNHGLTDDRELTRRVSEAMEMVRLPSGYLTRHPHAFSGGERQRVNIARALITRPRLVVADEAVSALDVSVRASVLNLLRDLQEELDLTYLFISHDLSVVRHVCDRVAVMYLGRIVEVADTDSLYGRPRHPYTEALLSAVPRPDPRLRGTGNRIRLPDDLPDAAAPPAGCSFHTRCPYARPEVCAVPGKPPPMVTTGPGHAAACVRTDELGLAGA
ncbi:ABC transporter ATP-binding protein [Streptomyces alkaliphilus]|uniref:ABC transporter ATP-binding protein n=1 Tax=Streptomyces alkaliphilus TaxID=1472722 RepID=UPI0011812F58|nr:oligopeptide/dipeptide ABC transporter ATP-binding protein [Streptomyces alkaliphilus]MQS10048.1 ATP-binding cassette domain-containing protein [Streptomyces alkaliphilus]